MRIVGIQVFGAITMMPRATAWSLLVMSTLGGPVSIYYLLFSIWMTAHPLYDSQAWRIRVYERFGITALDGLIWLVSIIWLWRMAKDRQRSE
jgi:hypothetical protein